MQPVIVTESLSKTFHSRGREVHALRDVSLQVMRGEIFGLFGPNGAGKSTLVHMLTTLLQPSSGTATVNGFDTVRDALRVRASVGLVMADERSFYGKLTPRQNLGFYAALQNVTRRRIGGNVERVLALFDLQEKADAPFQSLSTGQKQRLNMARALVHDPPILLLDEPTKGMDVQIGDFTRALIKDELVGRQKKTVIFISHVLYEMDGFCDRVAIMGGGKVRAVGTPEELSRRIPRQAVYQVRVEGDPDRIAARWRTLSRVDAVVEVSRGITLTTFEVTLSDEKSGVWLQVMDVVGACGGRVESYHRVDGASLRDVVKFFAAVKRERKEVWA